MFRFWKDRLWVLAMVALFVSGCYLQVTDTRGTLRGTMSLLFFFSFLGSALPLVWRR